MKHIITLAIICLAFAVYGQKKERITYDSTGKVLYITREVTEVIDTAKMHTRLAAIDTIIRRKMVERDTILAQLKTARKLMTGKKGGGANNKNGNGNGTKKNDIQPLEPIVSPAPVKPKKPAKKGGKNAKN